MTERRSLSSAMEITPEKLAFIQGTPVAPAAHSVKPETVSNPEPTPKREKRLTSSNRNSSARVPTANSVPEQEERSLIEGVLVPLTTRLQPKTADALRRAYLEQKLQRRRPATQQEIVEAALQGWLRKEGFL